MKNLKSYVEMQVNLQKVCDEKSKVQNSDQTKKLLEKSKTINGRMKKLGKEILVFPEVSGYLSRMKLSKKPSNKIKASEILERFKKNEITALDINLILRRIHQNV